MLLGLRFGESSALAALDAAHERLKNVTEDDPRTAASKGLAPVKLRTWMLDNKRSHKHMQGPAFLTTSSLQRFCLGATDLAANDHSLGAREQRMCRLCVGRHVKDEKHFLLVYGVFQHEAGF